MEIDFKIVATLVGTALTLFTTLLGALVWLIKGPYTDVTTRYTVTLERIIKDMEGELQRIQDSNERAHVRRDELLEKLVSRIDRLDENFQQRLDRLKVKVQELHDSNTTSE